MSCRTRIPVFSAAVLAATLWATPALAGPSSSGGAAPTLGPGATHDVWSIQMLYWRYFGEPCDGRDNDRDGDIDEGHPDTDGDGLADCVDVERCDGLDNDGDGEIDEGIDVDADGVSDCLETCTETYVLCSADDGTTTLQEGGPAVATWDKNIRWARIDGATWLWDAYREPAPEEERTVQFFRQLELPATTFEVNASMEMLADNRYLFWLNGEVAAGSLEEANFSEPTTFDVSSHFQAGTNRLHWRVRNSAQPRSTWMSNPAGFAYCLEVEASYAGPDEICNGLDDDCDGLVDEDWGDSDGDGIADCVDIEECDGFDNDGNGEIDEGYSDVDGDGIADCVDRETCDGLDNDGDGLADEGIEGFIAAVPDAYNHYPASHALYLPGLATDFVFDEPATFTEDPARGTAWLTGIARSQSHPDWAFDVDVRFIGATQVAPPGSPKLELLPGAPIDPSTWRYYTDYSGSLDGIDGLEGAWVALTRSGPAFQIGEGANGKNVQYGASGWFTWATVEQPDSGSALPPSGTGDFNLTGVGACLLDLCNGVDDDGDGLVDEGSPDPDGDHIATCVDLEICNGTDDNGSGEADDGFELPLWQLGVFDESQRGYDAAAEFLTTDTFHERFDYEVFGIGDPAAEIPGYLSNVLVTTIDPGRAPADATPWLEISFFLDHDVWAGVLDIGRYGDEEASVFLDMDGLPVTTIVGVGEGQNSREQIFLGTLTAGWHTVRLMYGGGGSDNGFYLDAIALYDATCEGGELCNGLDDNGDGTIDEVFGDVDHDGIADCIDTEECDGRDNDGDGLVDEGAGDSDGDGIADCLDVEECDGLDNDGDGYVDEDFGDSDLDGLADCLDTEECDGLDNDGDGYIDEGTEGYIAANADLFAQYGGGHALVLNGIGSFVFETPATFSEDPATGSARLTGTAVRTGHPSEILEVDVELAGGTDTPQAGSPKLELLDSAYAVNGGPVDPSTWSYYTGLTGTLTGHGGLEGAEISISLRGVPWQIGPGANGKNVAWGASAWLDYSTVSQPDVGGLSTMGTGDFNLTGLGTCGPEACNGLDDDGDGLVDEGYDDPDGDGLATCVDPEICDGVDNDGNGQIDEGSPDTDGDGIADCVDIEECDGLDNNGDGVIDEGAPDSDGDGLQDCLDIEECDDVDNDGDGLIDEGFTAGTAWAWSGWGGGNNGAGTLETQTATYDPVLDQFSFSTTLVKNGAGEPNGFTLAVSPGPNPKGFSDLALVYFDASSMPPILTVYSYNGEDLFSSYYDGQPGTGTAPPDRIQTSLYDDFVVQADRVDDGTRVTMSFTINTSAINHHDPLYVAAWDWNGMRFGHEFGLWFHVVTDVSTAYDTDGWLTSYGYRSQGYIDLANEPTTTYPTCAETP